MLYLFTSCSNKTDEMNLSEFDGGSFTKNEFLNYYEKLNDKKKEEKLTIEKLQKVILDKSMGEIVISESIKTGLDNDSMFLALYDKALERMYYQNYLRTQVLNKVISDSLISKFYKDYSPQYEMKYIMRPFITTAKKDFITNQNIKINEAYNLLESGTKFKDVVEKLSQDKVSKEKGGSIGWTIKEALGDPMLRLVMDTLTAFTYSKPFKGYNGFYILYKGDKRNIKIPPFNSVSKKIQETLKHTRQYLINIKRDSIFALAKEMYNYHVNNKLINEIIEDKSNSHRNSKEFPLKYQKLSNEIKFTVIASYNNYEITVGELFKRKNLSPTNKDEFYERLNSVSKNHLIAKYAKDFSLEKGLKLDSDSDKIKEALLLQIYHYKNVKKKAEAIVENEKEQKGKTVAKRKMELEKELFKAVEDELKEKYNLKLINKNIEMLIELVNNK